MNNKPLSIITFFFLFFCFNAQAKYSSDIPAAYRVIAAQNKVPPRLLYALALNESRKTSYINGEKKFIPWPWTANYKGKGYFFKTRTEAYRYIKPLIEQGANVDVGLGQFAWKWHKDRFPNLWAALDPRINLSEAAEYLREQYEKKECNSWTLAVGCYHRSAQSNRDKRIARSYTLRVLKIWEQLK